MDLAEKTRKEKEKALFENDEILIGINPPCDVNDMHWQHIQEHKWVTKKERYRKPFVQEALRKHMEHHLKLLKPGE